MKKNNSNYDNSKALFVLKIVTMSFAILACVIVATAMLTRWISDINRAVKESRTKIARATARLNKFRKNRIKHILKLRKLQLKEEKENARYNKKYGTIDENDDELDNIALDDL
jgi:cytidylate kinase